MRREKKSRRVILFVCRGIFLGVWTHVTDSGVIKAVEKSADRAQTWPNGVPTPILKNK